MDLAAFLGAALTPRTASIACPQLAAFFSGEETPEWQVRGLTAAELGRANLAASSRDKNVASLVEAMAGEGDKAKEIRALMGLGGDDVPPDVSRRIEMLAIGSVKPALGDENRDIAVRLAEAFPTLFFELTNQILLLTGEGAAPGKPLGSGSTRA